MATHIKLTDTQRQVLEHAATHPDGLITWFPDNVKGGARRKVLDGLSSRDLITCNKDGECFIADAGYNALGRAQPLPASIHGDPQVETAVAATEANQRQEKQDAAQRQIKLGIECKPRTRENTKQAQVIAMLQRPEGATVAQICASTGWQPHTVRGAFASAFKKKLGLNITSSKDAGAERYYRIG